MLCERYVCMSTTDETGLKRSSTTFLYENNLWWPIHALNTGFRYLVNIDISGIEVLIILNTCQIR